MRLSLALLFLSAFPAAAQEGLVVAECGARECRCVLSDMGLHEMELLVGSPPPATARGIVFLGDKAAQWMAMSPEEVEITLGGDGRCDRELFQDWVPENGTWDGRTAVIGATGRQGCMMAASGLVETMNRAPGPVTVDWGGRFDMERFYRASNPSPEDDRPVWTQVDFRTVTGRGGGDGVVVTYRANLLSPVRFTLDATISGEGCSITMRTTVRKRD
jgi:hypothetical protein